MRDRPAACPTNSHRRSIPYFGNWRGEDVLDRNRHLLGADDDFFEDRRIAGGEGCVGEDGGNETDDVRAGAHTGERQNHGHPPTFRSVFVGWLRSGENVAGWAEE